VEYLLERTGKTKMFLALDEALAGEEALLKSFRPSRELKEGWTDWYQSSYEAWRLVEHVMCYWIRPTSRAAHCWSPVLR
jgi:hypothetical protein